MPNLLSMIRSLFARPESGPPPGNDQAGPPSDDDFRFGREPTVPPGLRDLKIERLADRDALLLTGYDVDLTVDQTTHGDQPGQIAWSSRCLKWAKSYHGLDEPPSPPVRLHGDNVVLLCSWLPRTAPDGGEAVLRDWLGRFDWSPDRAFSAWEATTDRPIEDGYIRCLRFVAAGGEPRATDDARLAWVPSDPSPETLPDRLTRFLREQAGWLGDGSRCESFLRARYASVPKEQLTHPAFALLDFPMFDMGTVRLEFAGSVISPEEMRFWSRSAYFHK